MEEVTKNKTEVPLISVVLLCYNHEKFIGEALDSVLMQKSVVDFEIIIGEDCSTDHSRKIIEDYSKRYPNRINLVASEENVGLIKNYIRCIKAVKSKYFAVLSGDDYWIDPLKLKKQVSYLEKNGDCGLVYTNFSSINQESGITILDYINTVKLPTYNGYCRDELIKGIRAIMNITCCYRTKLFNLDFFSFLDDDKIKAEDFPTFMWVGFNKKVHYLKDITTVYRVNKNSLTNSHNLKDKWSFVNSHVYIRNKFLSFKDYIPSNYRAIEIYYNQQLIDFYDNATYIII
jgi:glycosyltransferase involved in cell wall biosynthesis